MPTGTLLSEAEKGRIDVLHRQGVSPTNIGVELGTMGAKRSRKVVERYFQDPNGYGKNRRGGPKRNLTVKNERSLMREASNSSFSSKQLKLSLNLPIYPSRTRAYLNRSANLRFLKLKRKPSLSDPHKRIRLTWARNHFQKTAAEWELIVLSDEKRFNLGGPYGFCHYWHDLRKDEHVLSHRQNGGGGVMIWGGISARGNTKLAVSNGPQNSRCYVGVLKTYLLPFAGDKIPVSWTFQQDNASIHSSTLTKKWFEDNSLRVMPWPFRSADLNPIKNVWGWLARQVYAHNRQFSTVSELMDVVMEERKKMPASLPKNLIQTMQKRTVELVEKHGGSAHY